MSKPKKRKHHYISAFILKKFEENGAFTVIPLDGSPTHIGNNSSTGWLKDSHRADPLEDDPDAYEDAQSRFVESKAAVLLARLVGGDDSVIRGPDRESIEKLLILHHHRHPAIMQHVSGRTAPEAEAHEHTPEISAAFRAFLAQAVTFTADLDAKFSPGTHEQSKVRWAQYRRALDEFTWNIVRYPEPSLLLGDMLVCPSRLAPGRRLDERQYGWTFGLLAAERVTIALTPTVGLLLSRDSHQRTLIPEAFNRSTIGSATRFVIVPRSLPSRNPTVFSNAVDLLQQRDADVPK
ncbi:DUF4238 domain-containing protein (plasmid) [Clavibacter nebraskensis]|uniref:DUF4238 domain-containing protein n=1 Tax=Clavibacter nebraskensis TaxID=31963 RepID=UPI0020107DC5|nr:DUF4238 domain-containing protein [Clavibacter nebraskensis]UQB17877.1 DUF4238 domain-containing protein [Clavibacter nebraskensis]